MSIISSIIDSFLSKKKEKKEEISQEQLAEVRKELLAAIQEASEDGVITAEEMASIKALQADFGISERDMTEIKLQALQSFIHQVIEDNLVTKEEVAFIREIQEGLEFEEGDTDPLRLELEGVLNMYERSEKAMQQTQASDVKTYFKEAKQSMMKKDYTTAVEEFSQILKLMESPIAYYKRGVCYWNLSQKEEACNDWRKAKDLGYEKAETKLQTQCGS